MPGAGHVQFAADGVVDREETGGADGVGLRGLGGHPPDEVVEAGEQVVGREVEFGQGVDGGAQAGHGRGGLQAVAGDVADDQGGAQGGEGEGVVPVAADAERAVGGPVGAGALAGGGGGRGQWGRRLFCSTSAVACSRVYRKALSRATAVRSHRSWRSRTSPSSKGRGWRCARP